MTLLNTVSCIVPNTFDFNNDQPTDFLLYGKEDLDKINNTSIVDAIINYLIETKRLNAQLFLVTCQISAKVGDEIFSVEQYGIKGTIIQIEKAL